MLVAARGTASRTWTAVTHRRSERARAGGPRVVRRIGVGATVAVLLVAGSLVGNAVRHAGCGQGREEIIAQLVPFDRARAIFSEDKIKDLCHAGYMTTAASADVFAHHGAQLTSLGWSVTPSDPTTFPPYLEAQRGDLNVYVSVDRIDSENIVQLLASRVG